MANFLVKAPEGFKSLARDTNYILVRRGRDGPALFVYFDEEDRSARLAYLAQEHLRTGLADRLLETSSDVPQLPNWLSHLEGLNFDQLDRFILPKIEGGQAARDIVLQRVSLLQPAIERIDEILSSVYPDAVLNRIARECTPRQNETRYRNWFYTYIACSYNQWSLLPAWKGGDWDRTAQAHEGKKFGRPSSQGAQHGYPCTPAMASKIVAGFTRHAKLGRTLVQVYEKTLTKSFGCDTRSASVGEAEYFHPKGEPFPTYWQFRYHCTKQLTRPVMRHALMGEQSYRNEVAPKQGAYSEALTNVMQESRTDASYSKEFTSSYVSRSSLERKLCTAKIYCALSGYLAGIGFSPRAENRWAYKAALFCAAIPKSKFGEIIGYSIQDDEWPGFGLPADLVGDRGPGAGLEEDEVTHGITPSNTPQSNATVESRHARKKKLQGPPTYRVSQLTPIEMAKREVERALNQNAHSSATARTDIEMKILNISTPLQIWNHMNGQLRNDAQRIPFDDAVRRFLKPVKFNLVDGFLSIHGLRYSSDAFRRTNVFQNFRSYEGKELDGYMLEIAVRKAWVEADGQIIELDVHAPFQTNVVQLSLLELEQLGTQSASTEYRRKETKKAADSHSHKRFKAQTGREWDAGATRSGRAKLDSASAGGKRKVKVEDVA